MFNWVWSLLYGISKSIFQIIDGLLSCANMLCGIEPIRYQNTEMDFLTFLMRNKNISFGFVAAVIIGVILVVLFAVISLIRSFSTEKENMSPTQIYVKVGKILLTFIFIPVALSVLIMFTNVLMQTLYKATLGGSPDGLGRFLAGAFGQNARHDGVPENFYMSSSFDYTSTGNMKKYVDLEDYDFFFSWIAGIAILLSLASMLLMFVDRAISIVILFVFAPISLSTAVLDDGQRFKLWRDQFIVKFLTGYGCIIGINIFSLVIAAITSNDLVFFENSALNYIMKIAIVVGGSVSLNRLMALVGNLISQGAGSNELRDNAIATQQAKGLGMRALSGAWSVAKSPFTATRSAANFIRDTRQFGLGYSVGSRLGFNTDRSYGQMSKTQKNQQRDQMIERENYRKTGKFDGSGNNVKNAITGENKSNANKQTNNRSGAGASNAIKGGSNANNKKVGNQMVEMSILNPDGSKKKENK